MTRKLYYWGVSMNPTLQAGDLLRVSPYGSREVRRGDVVVFQDPGGPGRVVHRVVAVEPRGIKTQGDNCPEVDDWLLRSQDLLGRVVACERQGLPVPLAGSSRGPIRLFQAKKRLDRLLSRLLQPAYHRLARAGIFRGWLTMRLLCFPRPEGPEWQLWLGKLLVGRRLPTSLGWTIRRPFRLLVDETTLPGEGSEASGANLH